MKKSRIVVASLMLFAASSSMAMSPGRHCGTAVMGRDIPVDEPVVTIDLRAGCLQKTEKEFVVQADLVSGPAAPDTAVVPEDGLPQAVSRRQRAGEVRELKAAAKGNARLRLAPLDLSMDRDPALRSSPEMLSAPSASPQERSAAAALWRALTVQPEDVLRDAGKLQSLETSVGALQARSQKNQLAIETLNGQVKKAESERYANPLVYALAALLLIALAVMACFVRAWMLLRRRGESDLPWWRKNEPLEKGWTRSAPDIDTSSGDGDFGAQQKLVESASSLDLDLGANEPGFTEVRHMSQRGRSDFVMSMTYPARAVKTEALFDVQQQADFFVSLGQAGQAIEVLRGHISENVQTSALVYLDLFSLYHQLGREEDYEELRQTFKQLSKAGIPAFRFYKDGDAGPGLEACQVAMSRIEALWPSPKVLEIIEEFIFGEPDVGTEAFDREAYRELLLLYSVAREIIHPEAISSSAPPKFDLPDSGFAGELKTAKFVSTLIQPLSASVAEPAPVEYTRPFPDSAISPSPPHPGLDLDLSTLGPESDGLAPRKEAGSKFIGQFAAEIAIAPSRSASGARPDPVVDIDLFDPSLGNEDKSRLQKP